MDNPNTESYIYVYLSVGGWKSQLCSWDEEFQMVMPEVAGICGYATRLEANLDAESWAYAENCTAYLTDSKDRNYSIRFSQWSMDEFTIKVMEESV